MGTLPIPASMFFEDFENEILEYEVLNSNAVIGTYRGLPDNKQRLIRFLLSDNPQITIGYTVRTSDGLESFQITEISYERYKGRPEILNAHY